MTCPGSFSQVELRGLEPLTPCLQSMAKMSSTVHGLARSVPRSPSEYSYVQARWCRLWGQRDPLKPGCAAAGQRSRQLVYLIYLSCPSTRPWHGGEVVGGRLVRAGSCRCKVIDVALLTRILASTSSASRCYGKMVHPDGSDSSA
jgi:hypothetical protein